MQTHHFHYPYPFTLESGEVLPEFTLEYCTIGERSSEDTNVVWVCHALTGNAEVTDWWGGLFGEQKLFNPKEHFIICANMLGSCYGSTGPLSVNPTTGEPYFHTFPQVTVRDMVNALELLRESLSIHRIHTLIGGSMGGQQALEWAIIQPELIENLVVTATNAKHSAWGIAFNESQRMAIAADPTWQNNTPQAGIAGMKVARSIAMLSYRNYLTYQATQTDQDSSKTDDYRASSYQRYQGKKLSKRFNAYSYWRLSKAMDSHHLGRGRKGLKEALQQIRANTLVIGIKTDILFPLNEQQLIADYIPGTAYEEIDSQYGHDGFLVETEVISACVQNFFRLSEKVVEEIVA